MPYIVNSSDLGFVDLYAVDAVGPGPLGLAATTSPTFGRFEYPGAEVTAVDPVLGGGTFLFVQAGATITVGQVCELTTTNVGTNKRYDITAKPWAGTAIKGKPLGVAMVGASSGQWLWVQIQGIAVTATNGTVAVDDAQYWQASGTISSTVVASKQMVNAVAASANAATYGTGSGAVTLGAGFSLILLNRPFGQGAIT